MRSATLAPVIFSLLLTTACQDATAPVRPLESDEPLAQFETGALVVRVVWDGQGVAWKRVEVLELHLTAKTDDAGYAKFDLRPGEYTLRAYDINRGGPSMAYIDTAVSIIAGEEARIEVLDCLPCV